MPTPGFPDWVCVGAVVRPLSTTVYAPGLRFVITRIEFQPSMRPEVTPGAYAFALNPVVPDVYERVLDRVTGTASTVNLPMLIEHYEPTGEYLDENEHLVGFGTTMPVTMFAAGLAPGDEVVIEGSPNHDGVFRVGYAHHQHIMLNRDHEPVLSDVAVPDVPIPDVPYIRRRPHGMDRTGLIVSTLLAHEGEYDEPQAQSILPEWGEPAFDPDDLPDMERDLVMAGDVMREVPAPTPDEVRHLIAEGQQFIQQLATAPADANRPTVEIGQVWVLPGPNAGLWRVAQPRGRAVLDDLMIRLEHAREQSRSMTCTRPWLVEHGVRHDPPDPRTRGASGAQAVVKGQVWEIDPANTKYSNATNRLWRVQTITDTQIMIVAEDGSGKRLYWAPSRLLAVGTFVGDGVPRRTAYEHVLADELDDDA